VCVCVCVCLCARMRMYMHAFVRACVLVCVSINEEKINSRWSMFIFQAQLCKITNLPPNKRLKDYKMDRNNIYIHHIMAVTTLRQMRQMPHTKIEKRIE